MRSTRDRLEEWFSRMGFASAPQLAEDCMAHGDMEVWRVAHVVPDARMRVSMQWCYSPERYLTDAHGYPQGQLRVAVGYRSATGCGTRRRAPRRPTRLGNARLDYERRGAVLDWNMTGVTAPCR